MPITKRDGKLCWDFPTLFHSHLFDCLRACMSATERESETIQIEDSTLVTPPAPPTQHPLSPLPVFTSRRLVRPPVPESCAVGEKNPNGALPERPEMENSATSQMRPLNVGGTARNNVVERCGRGCVFSFVRENGFSAAQNWGQTHTHRHTL